MDKKCTLIAAALMVAGVFSANAQSSTTVPGGCSGKPVTIII